MSPFIAPLDRRTFLIDLGRFSAAVTVLGVAACQPSGIFTPGPSSGSVEPTRGPSPAPSAAPSAGPSESSYEPAAAVRWERVNLGFVSAYVLQRGGEAAIVDTGVEGSQDEIEASLGALELGWDAVGHVILTHRHADHVGSTVEVLAKASHAVVYAGAADIPDIVIGQAIVALNDGDTVFDLQIVATPGHTAGHIAIFDPLAGIVVAGDALNNRTGTLAGSSPQNTENMSDAEASVRKMAELTFETLLVGHGEPIVGGADQQVRELAATL
ncbi:MAG: MBL fold metallo-hydrolase [Chloroflexi bacterium]|nr:MBL fold metallo-hydrolase [Chloroflexota bacterium]